MPKAAMFSARSETVDTSGAFKDAFASTRCLIPADGFYEWTKSPVDGGKDSVAHLPARPSGILVRRPVSSQQEAGHNELHHHHRGNRRADEADSRPSAGDPRSDHL
jgi:hypothetical protein